MRRGLEGLQGPRRIRIDCPWLYQNASDVEDTRQARRHSVMHHFHGTADAGAYVCLLIAVFSIYFVQPT